MSDLTALITRAETLLQRIETILPQPLQAPDWQASTAYRYRRSNGLLARAGMLQPVRHIAHLLANTAQFVAGKPANNVLLTGARGTGKSSLVKACLNHFAAQGLRLIEVDKDDLIDLPDIAEMLAQRPEKFIIYCDDLSFEAGESGYKALKSMLDGSVAASTSNMLIYATSNRRHLLPEYHHENLQHSQGADGELHPGEGVEEKISLSERFGLWLSFYPFSQHEYLAIVAQWLASYGIPAQEIAAAEGAALVWALERGSRSGRVASQFARDYAGRRKA